MTAPCLLFFFSFSVSALVGCVDLAAPDKRRKLANASAVLTLLLLFCFCFYFRLFVFFFVVHFAFMLKINKV